MSDLKRLYEFWEEKPLTEKPMLAGRHDQKETLQIVRAMCKSMNIPVPKIKFVKALPKVQEHSMYAHYDFDRNIMYINESMNKNFDEFLKTLLHELYHAKDAKKYGKKFQKEYEKEIAMFQALNPDKADEWYKHNSFEINAEKFAQKNWKKWKKAYGKIQMRKHLDNDGF
tara:strand:- start:2246 stop:2755 length:510 start_codon:yes stop_codon:yes gene_type:complete